MMTDRRSPFPPYSPPPVVDEEHLAPPATLADLSARQLAVASLIAKAKPDKQIAGELGITDRMVRRHVTAIAFLIHADATLDVRRQIAFWWRDQVPAHLTYAA